MSNLSKALLRFPIVICIFIAAIFLPAGSWKFWQGWAWIAASGMASLSFVIYLGKHDPELLRRRTELKEKVGAQQILMALGALLFFGGLVLAGLDYRWAWSLRQLRPVPLWLEILCLAVVLCGFSFIFVVLRFNSYAGRTIHVEESQPVISTGPYHYVRHPMYCGLILFFLASPLALGSWIALLAFILQLPIYALRILNEEKILRAELQGYTEYCTRTRFRLVPLVW